MPFGAATDADGSVDFRLWAPAARRVELCLVDARADRDLARRLQQGQALPMEPAAGGWFRRVTEHTPAGTRYLFRIDGDMTVPDPASRFQPEDVHGASEVIDPRSWAWRDAGWRGRPWEGAVIYELHVGTFTAAGSFSGVEAKLDYLADLGVTALQLMPVADFPGARDWGYDGTCLFAPDSRYGRPGDLKSLVAAAHARKLMVFMDVVYNHFGPEGNYLHVYAPQFFTERHRTPWGAAINYDGRESGPVREFVIHNALYWLEEYHLDGLRLDAVHAIADDTQPDIVTELAERVHAHFGRDRHIHLILENDRNTARYLARDADARPRWYVAQWNDDIHHALHVLLTGEVDGYYGDYGDQPVRHLGRCLVEGYAYQGERSAYRGDTPRGEPSGHLPAAAFIAFLQSHDQAGNRACGERISLLAEPGAVRAALALLLLAPAPPMLFMGEEWGCTQPFLFFCDFAPELAVQVAAGRREEFARFAAFSDPGARARIPDPSAAATFRRCVLDWRTAARQGHRNWHAFCRELLALRRDVLIPRLGRAAQRRSSACTLLGERALAARWRLDEGSELLLLANFAPDPLHGIAFPHDPVLYSTHAGNTGRRTGTLPAWSVTWFLRTDVPAT
jgi:1,4-alpha-glucan branching enzyme/maltooligosyltrehalose trehalohydrolase